MEKEKADLIQARDVKIRELSVIVREHVFVVEASKARALELDSELKVLSDSIRELKAKRTEDERNEQLAANERDKANADVLEAQILCDSQATERKELETRLAAAVKALKHQMDELDAKHMQGKDELSRLTEKRKEMEKRWTGVGQVLNVRDDAIQEAEEQQKQGEEEKKEEEKKSEDSERNAHKASEERKRLEEENQKDMEDAYEDAKRKKRDAEKLKRDAEQSMSFLESRMTSSRQQAEDDVQITPPSLKSSQIDVSVAPVQNAKRQKRSVTPVVDTSAVPLVSPIAISSSVAVSTVSPLPWLPLLSPFQSPAPSFLSHDQASLAANLFDYDDSGLIGEMLYPVTPVPEEEHTEEGEEDLPLLQEDEVVEDIVSSREEEEQETPTHLPPLSATSSTSSMGSSSSSRISKLAYSPREFKTHTVTTGDGANITYEVCDKEKKKKKKTEKDEESKVHTVTTGDGDEITYEVFSKMEKPDPSTPRRRTTKKNKENMEEGGEERKERVCYVRIRDPHTFSVLNKIGESQDVSVLSCHQMTIPIKRQYFEKGETTCMVCKGVIVGEHGDSEPIVKIFRDHRDKKCTDCYSHMLCGGWWLAATNDSKVPVAPGDTIPCPYHNEE